ncbi:MAG: hypothetical protein V7661_12215 [Sulfitobacter sp.]
MKTQRRSCAAIGVATVLGAMTSNSAMAASTDRLDYVELLKHASSAVAFVVVMANVQEADTEGRLTPDRRLEEFMKRFGGEMPPQPRSTPQTGVGSVLRITDD